MPETKLNGDLVTEVPDYIKTLEDINLSIKSVETQILDLNKLFNDPETTLFIPKDYTILLSGVNDNMSSLLQIQRDVSQHLESMDKLLLEISKTNPEFVDYSEEFLKLEKLLGTSNKTVSSLSDSSNLLTINLVCIAFCLFFITGFFIARQFFRRM